MAISRLGVRSLFLPQGLTAGFFGSSGTPAAVCPSSVSPSGCHLPPRGKALGAAIVLPVIATPVLPVIARAQSARGNPPVSSTQSVHPNPFPQGGRGWVRQSPGQMRRGLSHPQGQIKWTFTIRRKSVIAYFSSKRTVLFSLPARSQARASFTPSGIR